LGDCASVSAVRPAREFTLSTRSHCGSPDRYDADRSSTWFKIGATRDPNLGWANRQRSAVYPHHLESEGNRVDTLAVAEG
jgi:hypothetical protein